MTTTTTRRPPSSPTLLPVLFAALLAAVSAFPATAFSQSPGTLVARRLLDKADRNKDKKIDREELNNDALFKKYDANKDGTLTVEEIAKVVDGASDRMMMEKSEPIPQYRDVKSFFAFDRDRDGVLDKDEAKTLLFAWADYSGSRMLDKDAMMRVPAPGGGTGMKAGWLADRLREMDKDGDEFVAFQEFRLPEDWFAALDGNGDKKISSDEFAKDAIEREGGLIPGFAELSDKIGRKSEIQKADWTGPADLFSRIDENRDRKVTLQEFDRHVRRLREIQTLSTDFILRYDMDGDGRVSKAEFNGYLSLFERADSDGDGYVTKRDATTTR